MNQQHQSNRKGKKGLLSTIIAVVIVAVAAIFNIDLFDEKQPAGNQIPVELVKTVDGDTIKVMYEGEERSIRYLLIDTPEMNYSNDDNPEPFAEEATDRNDELLRSGQVTIEFDEGDREDKYGRLLAYIYVDGKSVQKTLLEEGYARVAYVVEPNTKYVDDFNAAANRAKEAEKGVWSIDGYVTNRGFNSK